MERITRLTWGTTLALLLILTCGFARPAFSAIVFVNKNASGSVHDGKSWGTAFTAVQPAITAAKSGDEVWVAAGTYVERITLKASVGYYGGFSGIETMRGQRDWRRYISTIDGNRGGSTVAIKSPATESTILDGFTIRGGTGTLGTGSYVRGGGIYTDRASPIIRNNTITRNDCYMGGGIACVGGSPTITDNIIYDNSAAGYGGAIYGDGTNANVRSNIIIANDSYFSALYFTSSVITSAVAVTVVNNTIVGNTGYGVNFGSAGTATFANNLVGFNNKTASYEYSKTGLTVKNNDYFGNGDGNAGALGLGKDGNINVDPHLLLPGQVDAHVFSDSPLRDAGDSSYATAGEVDADGNPRILDGSVDIGAVETNGNTVPVIISHPRLVRVSPLGDDQNGGATWESAKRSVQAGIDASEGGEVWVSAGIYVEQIWQGCYTKLYGGFAGTETVRAQRNVMRNVTVLDGAQGGCVVFIPNGRDANVIDGFTIRNGTGHRQMSSVPVTEGGGIYTSSSSPTISNNIISSNRASSLGGGICSKGPNVVITGNTIEGNVETDTYNNYYGGGGICLMYGGGLVANNIIRNNQASIGGGIATVSAYGTAVIRDNLISANRAISSLNGGGGGLFAQSGTRAMNNTFVNNTAPVGGAITVDPVYGSFAGTNNILAFNSSGIFAIKSSGTATMSRSCFFGNTKNDNNPVGSITLVDIFTADPLFVNAGGGSYRLSAASPCVDRGDDSAVTAGDVDLDFGPRKVGAHVDVGAYEWPPHGPWSVALAISVTGGLTVADGIAYVAGTDGKVYARSTEDGSAIAGFPVDISAAVGAPVKLPSRPAVYYGKTGKAIYVSTGRGDVVRVLPNGTVAWHVRPLTGQTVSTPAVTPDGNVFVNLSTGSGPYNNFVFKLDEATGTPLSLSPFLGYTNANDLGDFSPAANNRYLYANSGWGSGQGLTLLNQDNLAIRSSFAGGEQCLSPLLLGSDLILATRGGKAYKVNAVTMNPDFGFGHFGVADIGSPISAAPFADGTGNVYIGTADGRILKWTPGSGAFKPFYSTSGRIAGMTINRTAGVLGFGTSSGSFVQVPLDNPLGTITVTPGGSISTGTVYDSLADRFVVVTDTGIISGYPSIR